MAPFFWPTVYNSLEVQGGCNDLSQLNDAVEKELSSGRLVRLLFQLRQSLLEYIATTVTPPTDTN